MKVVFLDYSELYSSRAAGAVAPEGRAGKFVQIRHRDMEYLVFAPRELASYHAEIVERFCRDKELSGAFHAGQKRFVIHDPGWVIVGGGKFEINREKKFIRIYDNSMAYGRFDAAGLREKIRKTAGLSDYEVRIE